MQVKKKVLIIGGGPSGLAAAIATHDKGAEVTLVEKRPLYSRPQLVSLDDSTLYLLKGWNVTLPTLLTFDSEKGGKIYFVKIKFLEEAIYDRIKKLGIVRIKGKFVGFKNDETKAIITASGKEIRN